MVQEGPSGVPGQEGIRSGKRDSIYVTGKLLNWCLILAVHRALDAIADISGMKKLRLRIVT